MEIVKAYRFRVDLNEAQDLLARRTLGACRFLQNLALEQRTMAWQHGRHPVRFAEQCADLTELKRDLPWLAEAPSQVLQQALKDLDQAFQNFFAGVASYPKFQKKGHRDSCRFPQGFKVEENQGRVFLPKLGWMQYRKGRGKSARKLTGKAKSITLSREGGFWFLSIICKVEVANPLPIQGLAAGADLGVVKAIALSTGEELRVEGMTAAEMRKIAALHQALASKTKFSRNREKLKQKIAKLYQTVRRRRRDGIHKATTYLAKNQRLVVIEDLRVMAMTKAPEPIPDPEREGAFLQNGAAAKAGLNRAILDKAWGEIRRQLAYKCVWYGSELRVVPAAFTSVACSECGHTNRGNRPSQGDFHCLACGHMDNADTNAAKNILSAGLAGRTVGHTGAEGKANPFRRPARNRKPSA